MKIFLIADSAFKSIILNANPVISHCILKTKLSLPLLYFCKCTTNVRYLILQTHWSFNQGLYINILNNFFIQKVWVIKVLNFQPSIYYWAGAWVKLESLANNYYHFICLFGIKRFNLAENVEKVGETYCALQRFTFVTFSSISKL